MEPRNARITPTRKLIRLTIGSACAPTLDDQQQIGAAKARPAEQQAAERERDLAEEHDDLAAPLDEADGLDADPSRKGCAGRGARRACAFGNHGGEAEQAPHAFRQTARVGLDAGVTREAVQPTQEHEQAAVPAGQIAGLDQDAPDAALPLELPLDLGCRR
jgi:hypothetical protein